MPENAVPDPGGASTALLTDQYELTMLQAALADGSADRRCTFEVFARRLPHGRRYGVVAGIERVLDAVADFRFDAAGAGRTSQPVLDRRTLDHLAGWPVRRRHRRLPGGRAVLPRLAGADGHAARFASAVILETLVLSILNHDCAIASAAARMVGGGRPAAR